MKRPRAMIPGVLAMLAPLAFADAVDDSTAVRSESGAIAVELAPTEGSAVRGTLTLAASPSGVRLTGKVTGLEPGSEHGFHVHEKGDCSAPDGSSAGGHFNPGGHSHGGPGSPDRHLGDMPNIKADASGTAEIDLTIEGATLDADGPNSLVGRGLIVHAAPDDYSTQPTGNSGARLACGAIGGSAG